MRLCNALVQYLLCLTLFLFIFNCYGHEHHNHVDPTTAKYSESAVTVDPLTKPIETANVRKNDFHQHIDDEHIHDTIDARLRAKHHLRQSVHQHTDDDKHENEQDYINRLNSALEKEETPSLNFQYEIPPTVDAVNNISTQNQTKEDIQIPLQVQNETITTTSSPPTTPIQTPIEQKQQPTEQSSSIDTSKDIPSSSADKSDVKVILDENTPSLKIQITEQQTKDPIQQNIVKEDILFIHKETISPHQQEETLNVGKVLTDHISSSSNQQQQQQQLISDTIVNDTLQNNNNSIDVNSSSSTPLQSDQLQQQQQPSISDSVQNVSSVDIKSDQEQILPERTQVNRSSDILLEQAQPPTDPVQNTSSLDSNSSPSTPIQTNQEPISETIQNTTSIDSKPSPLQENPQAEIIDTSKPKETIPDNIKTDTISSASNESPTPVQTSAPPTTRILRSATSRIQQNAQTRQRHARAKQQAAEQSSTTETTTVASTLPSITLPTIEEHNQSHESSTAKPTEPHVETLQQPPIDLNPTNETETETENPDQNLKPIDTTDLPRQVHVHDSQTILNELKEDINKNETNSLDQHIENTTNVDSFLINDHSPHLPRILENDDIPSTIDPTILTITTTAAQIIENIPETNQNDSKTDDTNNTSTTLKSNLSEKSSVTNYRQMCWRLPKPFEPTLALIENQTLRLANLLPEHLQTSLIGHTDDHEILMNRIWYGSICTMCFLFSFIFLSMGTKRLKQNKYEKELRARCQQLQQYNNQIELERATFERQNQKLSDEIDELKNLPVRDADEEIFELKEKYEQLHAEWKIARTENEALQREIDQRQIISQKYEFEMQKQVETVAYLNNEILRQKQELEKERETIARLQSNDLSLERFEKLQENVHELKSEITQLKQEKFALTDQLQESQEHSNQLDIDNNQLTIKMKQLKDLLEQKEQTITQIKQKINNDNDQDNTTEIHEILSSVTENNQTIDQQQKELLSTIDNDVEKANQHMKDLHGEIEEKTRRIKELDSLLNQEKDRCRELETKLKVVLELRERDAHLHIRQLGQTDSELRKARNDTERVKILQQQLDLKQQQLVDVQKVLSSEQTKFSEECSKLQHEVHEKWMEVKRLTRELDGAKKECEGLRRQITKYAQNDRSSQEKMMHKPVAQHLNNTGRLSSEPETNGSSPPPMSYQQGENFRPIDHERNDSGAASPSEMMRIRPPMFGMPRPPFFPPPFMPPPNPFMMGVRFPMPVPGPHGMISPIPHLMTNGSGGSDANSFEIVDSTNITPNSTSYDAQLNGSAVSPTPDDEQQATTKVKKPKKSLKKKTKTSTTTTVSGTKEDV